MSLRVVYQLFRLKYVQIRVNPCRSVVKFKIIRENKFNILNPNRHICSQCGCYHYYGSYSYIEAVKWCDFISNPNLYINKAVERKENKDSYNITKEV